MYYDLIIIGAGPAGYVAAIRAGQLGMRAALVESQALGGLCLNWGCIPLKSLMESARLYHKLQDAQHWGIEGVDPAALEFSWARAVHRAKGIVKILNENIARLLKKNAVDLIPGTASLPLPGKVAVDGPLPRLLEARAILIATGSRIAKEGYPVPDEILVTPKELLAMKRLPDDLVVFGCGGNAVELAQILAMTGHAVTLVCPELRLLEDFDPALERHLLDLLKRGGIKTLLGASLENYEEGRVMVYAQPKGKHMIKAGRVVLATKRKAVIPENTLGLKLEDGFLATDSHLRCSAQGVFAAGDVNGRASLAYLASAEGLHVVNQLKGHRSEMIFGDYPRIIYTSPEIAQTGKTELELKQAGIPYKLGKYPFSANGKSLTEGQEGGFLRILSSPGVGEVLGVQIIGANASDMIGEASAWMQMEGTVFDIAKTLHAHPTLSEVFLEAARSLDES